VSEDRLRPYQRDACEAVWAGWRQAPRQLVVCATGGGKTFLAAVLVWRRKQAGRTLWLAHRTELLGQAAKSLEAVGLTVQVERADDFAERSPHASDVVVASVPTLHAARLDKWPRHSFATIVADEAHHSTAESWMRVIKHFDTDAMGRRTRVLGLTATPDRTDDIALGAVYDDAAYIYGLREAIRDGWLVPLAPPRTVVCDDLDLRQIKVIAGDLSAGELEEQVSRDSVLHQIADPLIREAGTRSVVVYTPGVESARGLARVLAGYVGADAVASVDGTTPKDVRAEILGRFGAGDLRIVTNCMVLTEGWDAPVASCIAVARPTKSRSLLAQMIGRGTRALPGVVDGCNDADARKAAIASSLKPDCLVVDFTGRDSIDLVGPADVLAGGDLDDEARGFVKEAQEADPDRPLEDILEEAEQLALETEAGRELERKRARVQAVTSYATHTIDLVGLDEAHVQLVEDARDAIRQSRKRDCKRCHGTGERKRDGAPCGVCKGKGKVKGVDYYEKGPSNKQTAFLERHGIRLPESALRRQASAAIDLVITRGLCSIKQAKVLRRAGLRTDLNKSEAGAALDALSSAGWQATPEIVSQYG